MTTTEKKRLHSPHQPVGRWIRVEKRLAIYLRDKFRCAYCSRDLTTAAPGDVALDHLTPRSRGGSNDATNLTTACGKCNCKRGNAALPRFAGGRAVFIRKAAARSLAPYMDLARSIVAGKENLKTVQTALDTTRRI